MRNSPAILRKKGQQGRILEEPDSADTDGKGVEGGGKGGM